MARGHALIVDDSSTARIILARLLERADLTTKASPALRKASHSYVKRLSTWFSWTTSCPE